MNQPVKLRFFLTLALLLCLTLPALAQDRWAGDPPPHISLVEGAATLKREGRAEPAVSSMLLLTGDRLRTESGRIEVLFTDQSVLHLDQDTVLDLLSDSLVRLLRGRLRLAVSATSEAERYRVDSPAGWVRIHEPGDYRVAVMMDGDRAATELAVFRGFAALSGEQTSVGVTAGERSTIRGSGVPALPQPFNSAAWDTFDRWSEGRREALLYAGSFSSHYLPTPLRSYATTFDRYGTWRHESAYGYVWYPAGHASWRPYYNGRWTHGRRYGWTWVGYDPWAWPTHHYGRWGYSHLGWFWVPTWTWAPAWVSWAIAPDFAGWHPLGPADAPLIDITQVTNVTTVTNVPPASHSDTSGANWSFRSAALANPGHAWTVVPRDTLGLPSHVAIRAIDAGRLDPEVRSAFVRLDERAVRPAASRRPAAAIRSGGLRVDTAGPRGALRQAESPARVVEQPSGRVTLRRLGRRPRRSSAAMVGAQPPVSGGRAGSGGLRLSGALPRTLTGSTSRSAIRRGHPSRFASGPADMSRSAGSPTTRSEPAARHSPRLSPAGSASPSQLRGRSPSPRRLSSAGFRSPTRGRASGLQPRAGRFASPGSRRSASVRSGRSGSVPFRGAATRAAISQARSEGRSLRAERRAGR